MSKFDQDNWYGSEDDFEFWGSYYVRDSGRCYRMEPSISLRREMDGALVRRRISNGLYQAMLKGLKEAIAEWQTKRGAA